MDMFPSKCTGSTQTKDPMMMPPHSTLISREVAVLDWFVCFCITDAVQAYRRLPVMLLTMVELRCPEVNNAYVHVPLPPALQTVHARTDLLTQT